MTNTYTRHKTKGTGQLNTLEDRMSEKRLESDVMERIATVGRDGALTRGALIHFVGMGFLARLRWFFRGVR